MAAEFECPDIEDRLLAAIEAAGLDRARLSADDLGALDHFHTGGRRATLELLELTGVEPGAAVLDVGSGIGGAARLLAARGCRVDCLEPSPDFCRGARLLNRLTGLEDRVRVHEGSALDMPFESASFDLVWMQNVGMSIADKAALYSEVARVLRPGGRFAFQEVAAGPAGDPHFPVPWASGPSSSHLVSAAEMVDRLEAAGLQPDAFADCTVGELSRPSTGAAPGPLTLAAYVEDIGSRSRNTRRNLEEDRIHLVMGVFRKP